MVVSYRVLLVSKVRMNPYVRLLQEALLGLGIACSSEGGFSPGLVNSWLSQTPPASRQETAHVVHLHWLELLYTSSTWARSVRRLAVVLAGLIWGRIRGCKLVYTVHNVNPHEQVYPLLSQIANRVVFVLADAVHVHDAEAKASIARSYGRHAGVYVIPHGSYIGAYASDCTRQEARRRLGLADHAFVYLFLGQVRRYKGIEDLVDAFGQVVDRAACLLIAGNPHDAQYGVELVERIRRSQQRDDEALRPEIRTWLQYVPDHDIQYFMRASDVMVLPYRDLTTSGAAILAFSFGVPIIAPARGGFQELAADGRGITYDPDDVGTPSRSSGVGTPSRSSGAGGLEGALRQARDQDMAESGRKAWAWAIEHQWGAVARDFVAMYMGTAQPGK